MSIGLRELNRGTNPLDILDSVLYTMGFNGSEVDSDSYHEVFESVYNFLSTGKNINRNVFDKLKKYWDKFALLDALSPSTDIGRGYADAKGLHRKRYAEQMYIVYGISKAIGEEDKFVKYGSNMEILRGLMASRSFEDSYDKVIILTDFYNVIGNGSSDFKKITIDDKWLYFVNDIKFGAEPPPERDSEIFLRFINEVKDELFFKNKNNFDIFKSYLVAMNKKNIDYPFKDTLLYEVEQKVLDSKISSKELIGRCVKI